jgi:serine/threonine-protein kinase
MIAGKYRVDRILGQGNMGVVVAATDVGLERAVAIKFMLREGAEGDALERFRREARAAAALKSQHVAKVYEMGALDTGEQYIVMELLEGEDFGARLQKGGMLPVGDAVAYVLEACEAIGEAHAAGIVHRDIKPANLFLAKGVGGAPCVKVIDFGVSRLARAGVKLTADRKALGSPLYMSPEQIRAESDLDGRSDVWALGATLFELLGGRTPFHAATIDAVLARVLFEPPTRLAELRPDVPPALEAVILGALEKDRERRWRDVAAFAAALAPYASAGAGAVHRPGLRADEPPSVPGPVERAVGAPGALAGPPAPPSAAWAAVTPPASAAVSAQGTSPPAARARGGAAAAIALVIVALGGAFAIVLFLVRSSVRPEPPAPEGSVTSVTTVHSAAPPPPAAPASASAEPVVTPAPASASAPAPVSATAPPPVPPAPAVHTARPVRGRPSATPTAAPRPPSDAYHSRD